MTTQQINILINIYNLSSYVRKETYKRIDWAVEIFQQQYPAVPATMIQAYLLEHADEN